MLRTFKNNGMASFEELRSICIEIGVKFIACEMTMDMFGFPEMILLKG